MIWVLALLYLEGEIEDEGPVGLPFSRDDFLFGVLQPKPTGEVERIGRRRVVATQQAKLHFIRFTIA